MNKEGIAVPGSLGVPLEYLLGFIREDAPFGDITSELVMPDIGCSAEIVARQEGVVSGLSEAERLFAYYGADVRVLVADGSQVNPGDTLVTLSGPVKAILLVERTALNIIGRMSGISTRTRKFVEIAGAKGARCRIASTRKTAPGLRILDKKAVRLGGGELHRLSLSDGILIKDNHLAVVSLEQAVAAAHAASVYRKIEVEVESTDAAVRAAKAGADIILFDNMPPEDVRHTLSALGELDLRKGLFIEISGSVNDDNIGNYVLPGVDVISVGALTHSVRNFDVSLELRKKETSLAEDRNVQTT
jgi:nicotinate-nucleotide pyrophosphorylase (carboxylating)